MRIGIGRFNWLNRKGSHMCEYCNIINEEHFLHPKEGALRVWHIPQMPMQAFYFPVASVKEAQLLIDVLAQYDLFQFHHKVKPDYANASGLEVFTDDWEEWENEEGYTIDELMAEGQEG